MKRVLVLGFAALLCLPAVAQQTVTVPIEVPVVTGPPGPVGPPGITGLKTVLDFGAVCDDVAGDADEIEAALRWSEANQAPVIVPNKTCRMERGISVVTTRNHDRKWGIIGLGGTLRADYNSTVNFVSVYSQHISRFFTVNGVTLRGVRTHGVGLYLGARNVPGERGALYNVEISHVAIEGFLDGLQVEGEVFESWFTHIHSRDNARDGYRFGHAPTGAAGVCSDLHLAFFTAGQNGRYGVRTDQWMTDLSISHGYILTNQDIGLLLQNGTDKGVDHVGFENNCLSKTFSVDCAHIRTTNHASFRDIVGYNGMSNGARYLIWKGKEIAGEMSVHNARINSSAAQPASLLRLGGAGHTWITRGKSTHAWTVESPALWTCDFCSGVDMLPTKRTTNVP